MGKVRTLQIKNISKELVSKYPDVFTTDFEKNKRLLDKYLEFNSKHLRNRISGYIVNLMKMEKKDKNKVFQ
ncbi:MAG: 30S ribosomal protein S17e [Promethearchaeia archaeon]